MDPTQLVQSPFAALTFVAAPALLTNASSVLALSTINRLLRTRDRMHELFNQTDSGPKTDAEAAHFLEQVNRTEKQATMLLRALHSIYLALAAFASGTLVTLIGAGLETYEKAFWLHLCAGLGVLLGFVGVSGLVFGCASLFHATQISLFNIRDEANVIRGREANRQAKS